MEVVKLTKPKATKATVKVVKRIYSLPTKRKSTTIHKKKLEKIRKTIF